MKLYSRLVTKREAINRFGKLGYVLKIELVRLVWKMIRCMNLHGEVVSKMDKKYDAILFTRMPASCGDCEFDYDCLNGCMASYSVDDVKYFGEDQSSTKKPSWCPLKPLDDELIYNQGWIDCFKRIIGGDKKNG